MVIQSEKHRYTVISRMKTGRQSTCYQCKEDNQDFYIVVLFHISDRVKEYLAQLEWKQNFQDLEECFQGKHKYYVVFYTPVGRLVKEKLNRENCSLEERARIAKEMLERMLLQNMPVYFVQDGLSGEHVWINDTADICFQYELKDIEGYEKITMADVGKRLEEWLHRLFPREIKSRACEELSEYREFLKQGEYTTYMEIYDAFLIVYKKIMEAVERGEEFLPRPWKERICEWGKQFGRKYHVWMAAAGLLLLLCLTVGFVIHSRKNDAKAEQGFSFIGTINLEGETKKYVTEVF